MKKKGFTLIELLIVIAIIAILATIIIVALSNAAPKARKSAAITSLQEAGKAAQSCVIEGGAMTARAAAAAPAGLICNTPGPSSSITANWPTLDGYTYTITNTATAITAMTPTAAAGNTAITCTVTSGAVMCR